MASFANYLVKTQPQLLGRWSLWDKFGKLKKALRDAYLKRAGKLKTEVPKDEAVVDVNVPNVFARPSAVQRFFGGCRANIHGNARIQQQFPGWWGRGTGPFGRDFLWRRLSTGHLIGFATLFLAHEERVQEDADFIKRMNAYEAACENLKDLFMPSSEEKSCLLSEELSDYECWKGIEAGSNGGVYEAKVTVIGEESEDVACRVRKSTHGRNKTGKKSASKSKGKKKVAIKMIYNFDSSNTGSILRQAHSELITCGRGAIVGTAKDWQNGSRARMKPHPNIIKVQRAMVAAVPDHPEFRKLSPAVLPPPIGYGRSTAMFLVMERYDYTLADYLKKFNPSFTTRCIMALQLLDGVAHLERSNVAHRDLKSNNIFIEHDSSKLPRMVIGDFGCAFVPTPDDGLVFPFLSPAYDIRDGNGDIQPPEISNCKPGPDAVLDYRKADAWAAGLLLCEIMGIEKNQLESCALEGCQVIVRLIKRLLEKNVDQRMSCVEAAQILHLELFGPNFPEARKVEVVPTADAIAHNWLSLHAAETLAYKNTSWGRNSVVCDLFVNFLSQVEWTDLCSAFTAWRSLSCDA